MKTAAQLKRELERIGHELDAIEKQQPLPLALLSTLGITDWQMERHLVLREIPIANWPHEWRSREIFPERRGWPCHALGEDDTVPVIFFDGLATVASASDVVDRTHDANPFTVH